MSALRSLGVDVLVSMLTPSEAVELELSAEAAAAQEVGIQFVNLPTLDRGVPNKAEFRKLLDTLSDELKSGRHVAVHCRMGIGRSSLVAAGLLVQEGDSASDAWVTVKQARGVDVPDTQEQRAWLEVALIDS